MDETEAWHVVIFEPQQEFRGAAGIASSGIPAYVPAMLKKRPSGRGAFRDVKVPMFGVYGFFRARRGAGEAYRCVLTTRGVSRLLVFADAPAVISAADYAAIQYAEILNRAKPARELYPWKPGDKVLVNGLAATLAALDDDGRVTVLFSLFGRDNRVRVKATEVTAA